jgi:hypothetical protein
MYIKKFNNLWDVTLLINNNVVCKCYDTRILTDELRLHLTKETKLYKSYMTISFGDYIANFKIPFDKLNK